MEDHKKYRESKYKYLRLADGIDEFRGGGGDAAYQKVLYDIAKYIKPSIRNKFKKDYGIKQLSNQVIELNRATYLSELHHQIADHFMTDKIDGRRTILYLSNDRSYAVGDSLTELDLRTKDLTILDTELYEDNYYIFDVMVYEGRSLIDRRFEERLKYFDKFNDMAHIMTKQFIRLTDRYKEQIRDFKKEPKAYEVDGIILTPADGTYNRMKVYKYKPSEQQTIDLLIKKCPYELQKENKFFDTRSLPNTSPALNTSSVSDTSPTPNTSSVSDTSPTPNTRRTLYLLFCGIDKRVFYKLSMRLINHYNEIFPEIDTKSLPRYFPIQFVPSSRKNAYLFWSDRDHLDGEVGEFLYNTRDDEWTLKKIREDRRVEVSRGNYFGNNYKIAEFIWMAYSDPLIIEEIGETSDIYFQEHDNILQKTTRNFNSYVKSEIFKKFRNTNWVMDLASGRGQDLFRYSTNNMRNIIFIELDRVALMELIVRKHSFAGDASFRNNMQVLIQNVDLRDNHLKQIEQIDNVYTRRNIDLIVCNMAFHYMMKNNESLRNICKLINHYLKPKGRFVFSAFDGNKIVSLLDRDGGEWTVRVGDQIKYSLVKKYSDDHLITIGQPIEVVLPFSRNTYYKEYLINIETIERELGKYNIVMESNESFSKYLDRYKDYSKLDADDRKYIDLYHYYIFVKR